MAKAIKGIDLARKLCAEHPGATSRSLANRLYRENAERFPTKNAAYLCIRRARGNQGEHNRKRCSKTNERRENQGSGWVQSCPPSHAEEWGPFDLGSGIRVLSLSDAHVPYHHPKAITAAVDYARKKFKPDVVLINGDWCDFYAVSRWDKDPKKRDFIGELETCRESLSWLRGRFPKARFIFKEGNHEERFTKFIWNKASELWGMDACRIEHILKLEEMGIEIVGDQRPIMAGGLPILHGHELGNFTNSVNHARGSFLRTLHTVLVGHGHRTSTHCEPNMFGKETTTWSQGCLSAMNAEYARFAKWNHGFATVEVADDGDFNLTNYRISPEWIVRTA